MKKFLYTLFLFLVIILVPAAILLTGYLYFDPFMVLRNYSNYSNTRIVPNRDYVSTEVFNNNYKKYQYNAFVFGSSRTLAFKTTSWKKYLGPNDSPFVYDAAVETVYGVYKKVKYLDSLGVKMDHVLWVICTDVTLRGAVNYESFLFVKHPDISGESRSKFHRMFFAAYMSPKFLYQYYSFQLKGNYEPSMFEVVEERIISLDTITNDLTIVSQEEELIADPEKYYNKRTAVFFERESEAYDAIQRIKPPQEIMLREIHRIFVKNKTGYKLVIGPLYNQVKLHPADMAFLMQLFDGNLYDFSGENEFTNDKRNYYEASHYKTSVGDSILSILYKK